MSTAKCGDGAVVKVLNRQKSTINRISWNITFYLHHFNCIQTYNFLHLSPHSLLDLRRPVRPGQLSQRVDEPGHHFTGLLWWAIWFDLIVHTLFHTCNALTFLATLTINIIQIITPPSNVTNHCHHQLSQAHPTRRPSARWCVTVRSYLQVQIWESNDSSLLPHSQTLKDRATQLLRSRIGALVTQFIKDNYWSTYREWNVGARARTATKILPCQPIVNRCNF